MCDGLKVHEEKAAFFTIFKSFPTQPVSKISAACNEPLNYFILPMLLNFRVSTSMAGGFHLFSSGSSLRYVLSTTSLGSIQFATVRTLFESHLCCC